MVDGDRQMQVSTKPTSNFISMILVNTLKILIKSQAVNISIVHASLSTPYGFPGKQKGENEVMFWKAG